MGLDNQSNFRLPWYIFMAHKINVRETEGATRDRKSRETGKTSLKIPKGPSESVHRRRTDNTMAKRKSTKGQTTINKTYRYI